MQTAYLLNCYAPIPTLVSVRWNKGTHSLYRVPALVHRSGHRSDQGCVLPRDKHGIQSVLSRCELTDANFRSLVISVNKGLFRVTYIYSLEERSPGPLHVQISAEAWLPRLLGLPPMQAANPALAMEQATTYMVLVDRDRGILCFWYPPPTSA